MTILSSLFKNTAFFLGLSSCLASVPLFAVSATAQQLTYKDAKGIYISGQWRSKTGLVTKGPDGKVIFLYGETQPSVVCSPLEVCDIELQAGEIVHDVLVGDTVRWKVEPATSGASNGQTIHLIVKPTEPGLITSMVVTTSRRTYHIQLKSDARHYMARVGFDYPEDVAARFKAINERVEANRIPGAGVSADKLDFHYLISGSANFRPTRVYSDGVKTYIQFPASVASREAPVLFVVSGGQNRIVNYRMRGNMMTVDYQIDKAVLLSGVGWKQQKITIKRKG